MKVLIGLFSLLVVAIGVILALPFLIDLNEYQNQYKPLIEDALIAGGALTYRDLSAGEPFEYVLRDLELMLKSVHLGQSPSLHVATEVQPYNLPVTLDGPFGPLKETTDIDVIQLQLALGKTAFAITGSTAGQDAKVNITSPAINTAHLPIALPLNKPVELRGLEITPLIKRHPIHLTH